MSNISLQEFHLPYWRKAKASKIKHYLDVNLVSFSNTPGTAGGPGGRDRTLAVAKNRAKMTFFLGEKKITYKKNIFFAYIF